MDKKKQNINSVLDNLIEKIKNNDDNINIDTRNNFENLNDLRIKKNLLLTKLLNNYEETYLLNLDFNHLHKLELVYDNISFCDNLTNKESILMFWRSITKKVEKKEVLNFPMCVLTQYNCKKICDREIQKYSLSFLKNHDLKNSNTFLKDNKKENLFQKILIFFILDNFYGLSSDLYEYEYINLLSTKIYTFKIKDLIFSVPLKFIIILSPKTKLFKEKLSIEDYINHLQEEEKELLNTNIKYENFYELLLENFIEFFEKKVYNTKNLKQVMELSYETKNVIPGNIYILSKTNLSFPVYVLILYTNETHIKYLILFDSTIQKTFSLSIKIINKNDNNISFFYPNLIFEKSYFQYTIGF